MGLVPLAFIIWQGFNDTLGANPIEEITHQTGGWTLKLLLLTLALSPLRHLLHFPSMIKFRRMLGLLVFFYGSLHFLTYLVLDQFFDTREILRDIVKRPYITIGFAAYLMLIPLAITSTNKMMKRLGKRWKQLHQLVYIISVCAVLHYLWLVKADIYYPVLYGVILIVLLSIRVWFQRFGVKSY